MKKHFRLKITGRVQGVGFRYFVFAQAKKFNLTGYTKNENDNSILIEIEGEDKDLESFLKKCRKGPLFSKIEKFEIVERGVENLEKFEIQ